MDYNFPNQSANETSMRLLRELMQHWKSAPRRAVDARPKADAVSMVEVCGLKYTTRNRLHASKLVFITLRYTVYTFPLYNIFKI